MSLPQPPSELTLAMSRLRPYWRQAFVYSTVVSLLALAPIGYMRDVYGPVLDSRSERTLLWVTLLLVVALAMSAALEWVRARVFQAASVRLAQEIGPRVFTATFRANLHKVPGARQALADLRVVRNFITSPTMGVLMDVPLGAIFMLMVFFIHPLMGVMSLVGAALMAGLGWVSEQRMRPLTTQAQQFNSAAQNFAADSGRNALVIEAMGMVPAIQRRWYTFQAQYLRDQAKAADAQSLASALTKFVMLSQGSLLMAVGMLFTLLEILPPTAGAFLIIAKLLGNRAVGPLMQLINSWRQVVMARDAYTRLDEFLGKVPEPEQRMKMPPPQGLLTVENAAARAPGTKRTVVMDVTFTLPPGQVMAVIGPSGSGKSSLARLLVGLTAPILGTVRLDGVDIASWDKCELGAHLGYLPQDVELFDGTIAQNIARFGTINEEAMAAAVKLAGLQPLIDELPQGMNTEIGDDGATLSGGQRQRVGLARAVYGQPKLVVLDEPNSSLDQQGEADLQQALQALRQLGCTVIVITHREHLLAAVNTVLVLEEGRPLMYGARDKVLAEMESRKAKPGPQAQEAA
jgi:ATP-binding cassette subfamily C exporter for protease/lipase